MRLFIFGLTVQLERRDQHFCLPLAAMRISAGAITKNESRSMG
ncbi:hypothetical protein ABIF63_004266 [Bradyrhizobium japonicum]|uniref:Transposase n=1 Tax=Bradyrhizobium japonicum TaxID=375 RepID=A0ABV2RV38_BRAJP|nr:hypothetical protein [Bradyrhizobium japonicum]WLB16699.1 hypothetical protein QIH95_32330 [Bradyrhizobium japonicum]